MPRPISTAFLANSDLLFPGLSGLPLAWRRCESESNAWRWVPTLFEAIRFWACPRMDRNSVVRSCIEVTVMLADSVYYLLYVQILVSRLSVLGEVMNE
jgi:hypothetical protein